MFSYLGYLTKSNSVLWDSDYSLKGFPLIGVVWSKHKLGRPNIYCNSILLNSIFCANVMGRNQLFRLFDYILPDITSPNSKLEPYLSQQIYLSSKCYLFSLNSVDQVVIVYSLLHTTVVRTKSAISTISSEWLRNPIFE